MGSKNLIEIEKKYGGIVSNVKRNKVSPFDTRTLEQIKKGGMRGGDRMAVHGYAPVYSAYLKPFLKKEKTTLVEIGILKGSGLALWCDLFFKKEDIIIGLDIDTSHFYENEPHLLSLGAFIKKEPIIIQYDQLVNEIYDIRNHLSGRNIDIVIDDGLHTDESIIKTFYNTKNWLSDDFVYFIEDNHTVMGKMEKLFPDYTIQGYKTGPNKNDFITVVTNG